MSTLTFGLTGTISGLQNNTQGNAIAEALATRSQGASAPTTTSTGLSSTAGLDWHDTSNNLRKTRNQADTAWITEGVYDETDGLYRPVSDGPAATVRAVQLRTAGVTRWQIDANATSESGANAGSDFELWSYSDAGAQLTKVFSVTRSNGAITMPGNVTINGTVEMPGDLIVAGSSLTPILSTLAGWSFQTSGTAAGYTGTVSTAALNLGTGNTGILLGTYFGSTLVGSISVGTSTTAYNQTSDQRLKIKDRPISADESGRIIDRLSALWFRWKSAPDAAQEPGFFAQQVHRVFPWAVTKGRGRPGRTGYSPWQMDAAKLLPVAVAELQSLRARVAELESR